MQHLKSFFHRGLMTSVGGPIVLAIVYGVLGACGVTDSLSVREVVTGIAATAVLAFIAGGISIVYNMEKLPLLWATLIHATTLFADYLVIYLLNGWIGWGQIALFCGIFLAGYAAVWLIVWLCIRAATGRINRMLP